MVHSQYYNTPPPVPPDLSRPKGGDFGRAVKWGSGIGLGCLGPSCLLFFALIFFLAGFGATISTYKGEIVPQEKIIRQGGNNKIAVLDIKGVIVRERDSKESIEENTVSENVIELLNKAKDDKTIKGVVLNINSPGGYVSPTVDIYEKIKELKKSGKKVVVSMSDTAASGGYYVASPADKIFAERTTTTGSIGVIMTLMNLSGLFDKYGYKEVVIKSGEFKDMGSWSRNMTEEERKIFQQFIDEAYDDFVKAIAADRKMDESEIRKIADGRIYTGTQAKELGLIDEIGGFWDAVAETEKLAGISNATVVEFERQKSFKEELLGNISKVSLNFGLGRLKIRSTPQLKYQWIP